MEPLASPYPTHPLGLYPPQINPSVVVHTTSPPPFLSTFLWNATGFHPSRFAEYVNFKLRNSKFVFLSKGLKAAISASSVSIGSAHSSTVAGYCSGNRSLPNRFIPMGASSFWPKKNEKILSTGSSEKSSFGDASGGGTSAFSFSEDSCPFPLLKKSNMARAVVEEGSGRGRLHLPIVGGGGAGTNASANHRQLMTVAKRSTREHRR
mmetsp:Transcript_14252/g.23029  ORF Transcript_14252/g.23029 Transcript_14252/m.23029 type:complete len:207 (+) Transcript_14252:973-1593(+)